MDWLQFGLNLLGGSILTFAAFFVGFCLMNRRKNATAIKPAVPTASVVKHEEERLQVAGSDDFDGPREEDRPHLLMVLKADADTALPTKEEADGIKAHIRAQVGPQCPPILIVGGFSVQTTPNPSRVPSSY